MTDVEWDTRFAVVLRDDLVSWQEVNVTAFLSGGIAVAVPGITGGSYEDASGNEYLSLLVEPVFVYQAESAKLQTILGRARRREVKVAIYPIALFDTNNDADNRATIKDVAEDMFAIAGLAVYGDKKEVDRVIKGARRHV